EHVAVAVDDGAGDAVALAEDEPGVRGVREGGRAEVEGLAEAPAPEVGVDGHVRVAREEAEGDEGAAVVEALPPHMAARVYDLHGVARLGFALHGLELVGEDPRVATPEVLL